MALKVQQLSFFVRLPNGNGSAFEHPSNLTLQKLLKLLQKSSLQLPTSFRLIYQGKRIKDYSCTLQEIGVTNNSIIHIQPVPQLQHRSCRVDVAFLLNGDKFVVQQSNQKTIWDLKQGISSLTGITAGSQILVFLGKKLKNHKTLQHYKITSDSLLCLLIDSHQIPVKTSHTIFNSQSLELVNSVVSLQKKSSVVSKTTLFRSDSINNRNAQQIAPYEVEIHQKNQKYDHKGVNQLKFDLFNSYRCSNLMGSITFNHLYQSLRPGQYKQEQEGQDQELEQLIQHNELKIPNSRLDLVVCEEYKSIELDD